MKAADLKFLSEVADLARLDFEAASVSLNKDSNRLVATYTGAYSCGQRWRELPDAPNVAVSLSGKQFKDLVNLFDDDEDIIMIETSGVLRVSSRTKKIELRPRGQVEGIEPYEPTDATRIASVQADAFLKEVQVAQEFSARNLARAVLTGLRIVAGARQLGIQASDGQSILFETYLPATGGARESLILPALDLALGIRLIKEGSVAITRSATGNNLMLYGSNALFRCSLIAGEWPDFSKHRQKYDRIQVTIPSATIKPVLQSIKILGASNDIIMRGDGQALHLETVEAEAGRFNAQIASTIQGTYAFDASVFELVMHVGDLLNIGLPVGQVPTLITSGTRSFWLAPKL